MTSRFQAFVNVPLNTENSERGSDRELDTRKMLSSCGAALHFKGPCDTSPLENSHHVDDIHRRHTNQSSRENSEPWELWRAGHGWRSRRSQAGEGVVRGVGGRQNQRQTATWRPRSIAERRGRLGSWIK